MWFSEEGGVLAVVLTCFHVLFPICPLAPFLSSFSPCSPPRKVLCSVEQRAQHRAWRGTSPQSSGRNFLPEICVKKSQKSSLSHEFSSKIKVIGNLAGNLGLCFVGPAKPRKIPAKFPTGFPCNVIQKNKKNSATSFCGAQGQQNPTGPTKSPKIPAKSPARFSLHPKGIEIEIFNLD